MSSGQATQLVTAVAQLVGVLIWPAVLVFFLIRFRHGLADFLGNLGELSFKAPEAAAALGAAIAARAPANGVKATATDTRDVLEALPTARSQRRLQGKRILWIDDRPDNNRFERQALEAFGVRIDLSTSTDDALQKTRQRSYDLIISDMGRPPDARAGYTLLDELRRTGDKTPFIIYAGSRAPEHVEEARRHGAIGATNMPQDLIAMATKALAE